MSDYEENSNISLCRLETAGAKMRMEQQSDGGDGSQDC